MDLSPLPSPITLPHYPPPITLPPITLPYTKKLKIFHKKRDNLHRLISRGVEKAKLLQAADEVRLAKIRAVQAQRPPAFFGPNDRDEASKWTKGIHDRISVLQTMTPEEALVEFGQ